MDSVVLSDLIAQFVGAVLGFTVLLIGLSKLGGFLARFAVRSPAQRVMTGCAIAILCGAALYARAAMTHDKFASSANLLALIVSVLITLGLTRRRVRIISERAGDTAIESNAPAFSSSRQVLLWSGVAVLVLLIAFYGRPLPTNPTADDSTRAQDTVAPDVAPTVERTPPPLQSADIVAGVSDFERTFKSVGFAGTSARSSECYEAMLPALDHADQPWSAIDRCVAFDIAADQLAQSLVDMGVSGNVPVDAYFGRSLVVQSGSAFISHGIAKDVLIERIKLMEPMVKNTKGTTTITFGDMDRALKVAAASEANRSTDASVSTMPVQSDAGLAAGSIGAGGGVNAGGTYGRDQLVSGYTRANGTVVQPYHRSAPDSTMYNNYSARGNVNPYTGESGHVQARH